MGFPKAALTLDGRSLVMRAADRLASGGCDRVLVVVSAPEVAELVEAPIDVVWNPRPETGMLGSLRSALHWAGPGNSFVFTPVDLPGLSSRIVSNVIAGIEPETVVRPSCEGRRGHPVGFGPVVAERLRVPGDESERLDAALRRCGAVDVDLPTSDSGVLRDVDTPEQWRDWLEWVRLEETR